MSPDDHNGSGAVPFQDVIDPFIQVCPGPALAVRARLRKENPDEIRLELDPKDDSHGRWLLEKRALELARSHLTRTQRAVIALAAGGEVGRADCSQARGYPGHGAVTPVDSRSSDSRRYYRDIFGGGEIDCVIGCRGRFNAISTNRKPRDIKGQQTLSTTHPTADGSAFLHL